MGGEWRGMWRGENKMFRTIHELRFLLGIRAPQEKDEVLFAPVQFLNDL